MNQKNKKFATQFTPKYATGYNPDLLLNLTA
jgi:hypothetical protein